MQPRHYVNLLGTQFPFYGVCVGIGAVMILLWFYYQKRKYHYSAAFENEILMMFPFAMLTGVCVAFLLDAVCRSTWKTWESLNGATFGFSYFGWLLGVFTFLYLFGEIKFKRGVFCLNLFLPALALAQAFGRIGCLLGGCCYGVPCEMFGIVYPEGSFPYEQIGLCKLLPIQGIEAGFLFVLFYICYKTSFRYRSCVYLIGVAILRFVLEYGRYDNRGTLFNASFSPAQFIAIFLLILGTITFYYCYRNPVQSSTLS